MEEKVNASYLKFWDIKDGVFNRSLNEDNLCLFPDQYLDLQRAVILCQQEKTRIVISGAPETGKTTIGRWITAQVNVLTHEVFSISLSKNPPPPNWLLRNLNDFLLGPKEKYSCVNKACVKGLEHLRDESRGLVIVVDHCERLTGPESFVNFDQISELAGVLKVPMSLILIGEPELWNLLDSPPHLGRRVSSRLDTNPLNKDEIYPYLNHYLQIANLQEQPFSHKAVQELYKSSGGVHGLVGRMAENCLIEGFLGQTKAIGPAIVTKVAESLITYDRNSILDSQDTESENQKGPGQAEHSKVKNADSGFFDASKSFSLFGED